MITAETELAGVALYVLADLAAVMNRNYRRDPC
jgi:hypothetical protein